MAIGQTKNCKSYPWIFELMVAVSSMGEVKPLIAGLFLSLSFICRATTRLWA